MKVAVIGGGAAGFFSAISVKENNPNANVTIFEKTKQLIITMTLTLETKEILTRFDFVFILIYTNKKLLNYANSHYTYKLFFILRYLLTHF